ncbi:TLDc domain-containing protein [Entamoeba marina]
MGQTQTVKHLSHCQLIQKEIDVLIQWCELENYKIIFDSDIDGDGKGTLVSSILDKSNLYFIHIDKNDNVYGGYIPTKIHYLTNSCSDTFVFSLLRNGKVKNERYFLKDPSETRSFWLSPNNNALFFFGCIIRADICTCRIGDKSHCDVNLFDYKKDKNPLTDCFPNSFKLQRILVIEMNE